MHQLSQRRIIFHLSIHIQNMRPVSERFAGFLNSSFNTVNRTSAFQHIMLRDKDHIGFIQILVLLARLCDIRIDQTAVISRTLDACTSVIALNFDVVHAVFFVNRQNIQPCRASLQIFHLVLHMHLRYLQIASLQDNLQQKFRACLILEHLIHKVIVQQTQCAQTLQVLCMLALKIQTAHIITVFSLF